MATRRNSKTVYRLQTRHNGLWFTYGNYKTKQEATQKAKSLFDKGQSGDGYQIKEVFS